MRQSSRTDRWFPSRPRSWPGRPTRKHLTYLDGGELMDVDPATGKVARDGERGQDDFARQARTARSRTAIIASATTWPATCGRRTPRICSSTPTAGSGSTICTTAPACKIGFTGAASGDDPKFSPDGAMRLVHSRSRLCGDSVARAGGTPRVAWRPRPSSAAANGAVVLNGEVDWVYEEELDVRSNYFWSPDSKNHRLSADERDARAAVSRSPTGFPPTRRWTGSAIRSRATPNPEVRVGVVAHRAARRRGCRFPSTPATIHSALWLGRSQDRVGGDPRAATTSAARCTLPAPNMAMRARCSKIGDEKFLDENYDVAVGGGAIVLTQLERRTQPPLPLQLRQGQAACRRRQTRAATDQGRF